MGHLDKPIRCGKEQNNSQLVYLMLSKSINPHVFLNWALDLRIQMGPIYCNIYSSKISNMKFYTWKLKKNYRSHCTLFSPLSGVSWAIRTMTWATKIERISNVFANLLSIVNQVITLGFVIVSFNSIRDPVIVLEIDDEDVPEMTCFSKPFRREMTTAHLGCGMLATGACVDDLSSPFNQRRMVEGVAKQRTGPISYTFISKHQPPVTSFLILSHNHKSKNIESWNC